MSPSIEAFYFGDCAQVSDQLFGINLQKYERAISARSDNLVFYFAPYTEMATVHVFPPAARPAARLRFSASFLVAPTAEPLRVVLFRESTAPVHEVSAIRQSVE